LAGMLLSALSAPIYAKSLCDAVLRRTSRFVVTPKGDSSSPDRLTTFRIHLLWAGVFGCSLIGSFFLGHSHAVMRTWAVLALALCLAPVVIWSVGLLRHGRRRPARGTVPTARADSPCPAAKEKAKETAKEKEREETEVEQEEKETKEAKGAKGAKGAKEEEKAPVCAL
ncbi:hypothetical protein ACI2L5_57950, partial [Streptomyces milbemycinicus]